MPSRVAISFKDFASPDSSIASQRWPLASASWMEVGATSHGLTGAVSPFGKVTSLRPLRRLIWIGTDRGSHHAGSAGHSVSPPRRLDRRSRRLLESSPRRTTTLACQRSGRPWECRAMHNLYQQFRQLRLDFRYPVLLQTPYPRPVPGNQGRKSFLWSGCREVVV